MITILKFLTQSSCGGFFLWSFFLELVPISVVWLVLDVWVFCCCFGRGNGGLQWVVGVGLSLCTWFGSIQW